MKRFVIGDIHGRYNEFISLLKLVNFNYSQDMLFSVGDLVDRGPDSKLVVEEFLKIKNKVVIQGNHDEWLLNYCEGKIGFSNMFDWVSNGGGSTLDSYSSKNPSDMPITHVHFLRGLKKFHIEDNLLFVHAGLNENIPIESQNKETLLWDRNFVLYNCNNPDSHYWESNPYSKFDNIFIGHTPVQYINDKLTEPIKIYNNIWIMDTGAGYRGGYLSIMDIDSGEILQEKIN